MTAPSALAVRLIDSCLADPSEVNQADLTAVVRDGPPDLRAAIGVALVSRLADLQVRLEAATSPPLRLGVVIDSAYHLPPGGPRHALVKALPTGVPALCPVPPELSLAPGDQVVLSASQGLVMQRAGPFRGSEIGRVTRLEPGSNELVVAGPAQEEWVLQAAPELFETPDLEPGCQVRYCRQLQWATGVESADDRGSIELVDEIPTDLGWDDLGGLTDIKVRLRDLEELFLVPAEELERRRLRGRQLVLFSGPPGSGKTYSCRVLVASLRRRLGHDAVAFLFINAAELLHGLVGQSEANIRAQFARVRTLASQGRRVVMVWDEFESLFTARRGSLYASAQVDHTLVPTLLAELDGMAGLDSFLMIAVTNRDDLLDSAVVRPGRLGRTIRFRQPTWPETEAIFRVHLEGRQLARGWDVDRLAERAAAQVFTPQREGPPAVARVRLQDGRSLPVSRADVVSGALIAAVCEESAERDLLRAMRGGRAGLGPLELSQALDGAFAAHAGRLTPHNLVEQLDWPPDLAFQAVAVEPVAIRRAPLASESAVVAREVA